MQYNYYKLKWYNMAHMAACTYVGLCQVYTRNEIELKYKCQSGADVLDMTYIDPIELLVNIGDWWCTLHFARVSH